MFRILSVLVKKLPVTCDLYFSPAELRATLGRQHMQIGQNLLLNEKYNKSSLCCSMT